MKKKLDSPTNSEQEKLLAEQYAIIPDSAISSEIDAKQNSEKLKEIKQLRKEIEGSEFIKFALENISDPRKVVLFIAEQLNSGIPLSEEIKSVAKLINLLAGVADMERKNSVLQDGKVQNPSRLIIAPRTNSTDFAASLTFSEEGDLLRKFGRGISKEFYTYYNNQKIDDDDETSTRKNLFNIKRVEKFIRSLADDSARLSYLLKTKRSFLAKDDRANVYRNGRLKFYEPQKFALEIENLITTYEKICSLNQTKSDIDEDKETSQKNVEPKIKNKDLTLDRAIHLLNYFFIYAKVNCHNTKKAEFISFLTGYSKNTIVQKLSNINLKREHNFIEFEKDVKIARKYLEKIGLSEAVKMMDNDLASDD